MTLQIQKKIHFDANLAVSVKDENGNEYDNIYATFSADIDTNGIPSSLSYYIADKDLYKANLKTFRDAYTQFQNEVFTEADAMSVTTPTEGA